MTQIDKEYISTGKVKYVVRNLPLEAIHPQAFKAAEAAGCAGDQDKYWQMSERLFANQRALGPNDLLGHAQAVGLDMAAFQRCLETGRHAARIRRDIAEAQKAGARGTPTFFIGLTEPNGSTVKVLRTLRGAQAFSGFKAAFDSLLGEEKR